jgi:hypothetical protein
MPWQVVERVVSGNLIDVRGAGFVRLAGIDEGGELSRAFLSGLLSSQAVRVQATTYSADGMTEGFVFAADGRCVNVEMLRYGYARVRITPGFEREAEFRGLQADAERLKRGLWAPPPPVYAPPAPAPRRAPVDENSGSTPRFHVTAGGGSTLEGSGRDWTALADAGLNATRALGFYFTAGHARDLGDAGTAGSERAWHGSAGVRIMYPARPSLRPYLRAGGGYMHIERAEISAGPRRADRPFWEAGSGLLYASGRAQFDLGYTYARVGALDVSRIFGLFGIRF